MSDEQTKTTDDLDAELRKDLETSRAVGRYIRALKAFEESNQEFHDACKQLREQLSPTAKFVTKVDFVTYLITANNGSFDVEKVKVLH